LSHRAQYCSGAFARWSSACASFGKKQTFWNASDAASQSLATVGAREPPFWTSGGFPWPVNSPRLIWMFCAGFDVVAEGLAPAAWWPAQFGRR
jgi:hypothetical protein